MAARTFRTPLNLGSSVITLCAALLLTGCGSSVSEYARFTVPPPESSGPSAFTWEAQPDPVLPRGDASDVLNPSVVQINGVYWNFYSEFDGAAWHTAAATSPDGVLWTPRGRILSPSGDEGSYIAANGSALVHRDKFQKDKLLYWYQITAPAPDLATSRSLPPRIALAVSFDGGQSWSRNPGPVLEPGPLGSFDERGVADPYVIEAGGTFYMFYLGQDRARRQRLGLARSTDGIRWEKSRDNPVLGFEGQVGDPGAFDENGLGEPAVWSSGGWWWMLYTGRSATEQRRLGLARSRDGIDWQRVPDFGPITGDQAWDAQVICDPSLERLPDGSLRVWFGGGDVASPDEGLHGQIGLGLLRAR